MIQKKHFRRLQAAASWLLLLALFGSLLPASPASAATAAANNAMSQLNDWNVVKGYPGGGTNPDRPITRAEFVAMVNRAYGFTDKSNPKNFTDVPAGAWYADDIAIASSAGYFKGTSPSTASPSSNLSREDAMVLLAKCLRLEAIPGEVTEFTDGRTFGSWSRGYVKAAVKQGLIKGYSDGTFRPKNKITRGEMAQLLVRAVGTPVLESGEQTLGNVYGNVTISKPGTVLRDSIIAGNLYISGALGLGAVTLDNVIVTGKIVVSGGGESEAGQDSVILRNVEAKDLLVDTTNGKYVSLRAEGDTSISDALLRTESYVQDRTDAGYGLLNVKLDGRTASPSFSLSGNMKNVLNVTPGSTVTLSNAAAQTLTVDEAATGSFVNITSDATLRQLNLDTAATVSGAGDIGSLTVSASGSTVDILPDTIDIRPGVESNVSKTNMDTKLGLESSADPRILAGYPKAKDVAPASATAVFSTNKAGTLYWAVSPVSDGSITEDELINPKAYASKAVAKGNIAVKSSNTELTAAIKGLTKGGSYYLSAVLVDNRGARSPVKVYSFGTPDDTVPNFSTGYPSMTKITNIAAQTGVMTTKSCLLYYAVFPKGSASPTANDFKSQSLEGNLGTGVKEMTKNTPEYFYVNSTNLTELAAYDLYLWLTDADGAKSSAVKKLTFTTVDKTPPIITTELTLPTVKATTLSGPVTVNENGTVFWVAVKAGAEYPKPIAGETEIPTLSSTTAKVSVENGGGNPVKNGKVTVKANTPATLNITGLKAETGYDIYYVAKDTAGNYSEVVKLLADVHTLDTTPPKVSRRFDHFEENDSDHPYADTNIDIVFSETVLETVNNKRLMDLYAAVVETDGSNEAKTALAEALRSTIILYNKTGTNMETEVPERTYENGVVDETDTDWVIDFRNAVVMMDDTDTDGKRMIVRFYSKEGLGHGEALNLRSGSTYVFKVQNIADTSDSRNLMGTTKLPEFTTISAQAILNDLNLTEDISWTDGLNGSGTLTSDLIDLAFSMTPRSVSAVDNLNWDMLLWSDSSVTYELYYKQPGGGWLKSLNDGDITVPTSTTTSYQGNSLFRKLLGYTTNPLLGNLDDNGTYQFIIHITSLSGSSELNRSSWNRDVHFRVQVVTGTNANLESQSNQLGSYKLRSDVTDISFPTNYTVEKQFSDETPPYFTNGYPQLDVLDETGTLYVQTNRAATVYWVVAPVGYITTCDQLGNEVEYESVPELLSNGTADPLKVATPTRFNITEPDFSDSKIIVGKPKSVSTGRNEIALSGLQPMTKYYAYFVLQGSNGGATSNDVMVYRFETEETIRPVIKLNAVNNPVVGVTSNMKANVDYLVVTWDNLYLMNLLKQSFKSVIPGYSYNGGSNDPNQYDVASKYRTYLVKKYLSNDFTVLDALNEDISNNYNSLGSAFDLFADQSYKNDLASYIRANQAQSTLAIAGGGSVNNLPANTERPVDCSKTPINLKPLPTNYVFLAVGRSTSTSAEQGSSGDAFRAIYPIYLQNNIKPTITTITPQLTYNATTKTVSGTIRLLFNDYLYYKQSGITSSSNTMFVDRGPGVDASRPSGYISLTNIVSYRSNSVTEEVDSSSTGKQTNLVVLKVTAARDGDGITFNQGFCDLSGTATQVSLEITIRIDSDGNPTVTPTAAWMGS